MENNTTTNTDLKVIYKCLFITRKEDDKYRIIHGRIIKWIRHPLDYEDLDCRYYNEKDYYIFFVDRLDNPFNEKNMIFTIDLSVNKKIYNLFFKWTEKDNNIFLEQGFNQKLFNPFISYCTNINVLFSPLDDKKLYDEVNKYNTILTKVVDKIYKNSRINLVKNPELINSIIYYEPYRITSKFKGFKEDKNGFKISIDDEFNQYGDFDVKITYYINNNPKVVCFKVIDKTNEEISEDVPDTIEVTIEKEGLVIYKETSSILKHIQIKLSYLDKVININKKIEQYTSNEIIIGEKDL